MPLVDKKDAELASARSADFLQPRAPWHRRLWSLGSLLVLGELLEAAQMRDKGVLSGDALKYLAGELKDIVAKDPALSPPTPRRSHLIRCIQPDLAAGGIEWRALLGLQDELASDYLLRWAEIWEADTGRPRPERAARAIAAHLLDLGYSPEHLQRWWARHSERGAETLSLSELLRAAHAEHAARRPTRHRVLVPLAVAPRWQEAQPGWLPGHGVVRWIEKECHGATNVGRQHGGLLVEVDAHDVWAAVRRAASHIDSVVARFAVGTRRRTMRPTGCVWVAGHAKPLPLSSPRHVEVRALERENRLIPAAGESGNAPIVDAALHLLGPLHEGPASTAAASGWAAIEATLVLPGDRSNRARAADLLASLVACSWPRAELTTLAHRYAKESTDDVAQALADCETHQERAQVVRDAIRQGRSLAMGSPSDAAALARLVTIEARPGSTLRDVEMHVARAFRRLYRQRNLVLHGGEIEAVALSATLRVVAPLVGAGFDRIAHAALVEGTAPADIAARAFNRLHSLNDGDGAADLVGLLE